MSELCDLLRVTDFLPHNFTHACHSLDAIFLRVPLGFVCGYPVGTGGELYGGSMFIRSAASDTLQGRATQAVNSRWGDDFRQWTGRESLGIPVCKKKYAPFSFKIVKQKDGSAKVTVERMFGCRCHSNVRKAVIEQHGCRKGWEPFGQWSLRKATEKARRETERINRENRENTAAGGIEDDGETSDENWSSDDEKNAMSICNNGNCTWKLREKYDDIMEEIQEQEESEEEERDSTPSGEARG